MYFGLIYISSIIAIDLLIIWPFVRGSGLINPVESLKWSWEKSRQFATAGILSGALIGFIGGLVVGVLWAFDVGYIGIARLEIKSLGLPEGLFLTLVVGLIFSGIFGLFSWTRGNTTYAFPKKRTGWFWKTTRFALILGLVLGILLTLGLFINSRATMTLFVLIFVGKIFGLILGLIIALILGLIAETRRPRVSEINNIFGTEKMFSWSWREGRRIIFSGILVGVFIGAFGGLIWGSFLIFAYPEQIPDSSKLNLFESLFGGLFLGLFYGVIFGGCLSLIFRLADTMIHVPALWKESWSWKDARFGLISGLVFGLFLGIALFFYPEPTFMVVIWIVLGIVLGIALGLIMAPIIGLIGGFGASGVSKSNFPNQGIWKSLKSCSIYGMAFGIFLGLIHGSWVQPTSFMTKNLEFDYVLTHRLVESVYVGLAIYGPICGGLFAGGLACFKHLTLRLMLTCQGSTPWNYAQFLDYAVDRFFMQKVGGGYIFVHRMLLEHFAEMNLRSK